MAQMRHRAKQTLMRETVKRRVERIRKMRLKAQKWREEEETEEEWEMRKSSGTGKENEAETTE